MAIHRQAPSCAWVDLKSDPSPGFFSGFTGRQYRRIYSYSPSIAGTVPSQSKHSSNLSTATPFAPFCIDLLSDCSRVLWITVRYHAMGERIENACLCYGWRQKEHESRMIARLSEQNPWVDEATFVSRPANLEYYRWQSNCLEFVPFPAAAIEPQAQNTALL